MRSTVSVSSISPPSDPLLNVPRLEVLTAAARTDPGLMRKRNEDAFACLPEIGLFVIADGVGGERGGEVASRIAVETIRLAFERPDDTWPGVGANEEGEGRALLHAAIRRANARIFTAAQLDPSRRHMGTTLACALVRGGQLVIAHVGDSRVYRYRSGVIQRLTEDHTVFAEGVRTGKLTPSTAARSTLRHVLTRVIGANPTVEVDLRVEAPSPGDVLLLCSDGLSTVVHEQEIAAILAANRGLDEAATQLVESAKDGGGPDNITCVLVRWPG